MSHDDGRRCHCQSEHRPAPLELERHHVWPLGLGGPDEDWNSEFVCPTTHRNAHELLREMMRQDRSVPYQDFLGAYEQPVSRWAYELARVGYQRWMMNAVGGTPSAVRLDRQSDSDSPLPRGGALYAAEEQA